MTEQSRALLGVALGAVCGAAAGYLFCTGGGRGARNRVESAVDEVRRGVLQFHEAIEKAGNLAEEGIRLVQEFKTARARPADAVRPASH